MILEMVKNHFDRNDVYINKIITPSKMVSESDKIKINDILLIEIANLNTN